MPVPCAGVAPSRIVFTLETLSLTDTLHAVYRYFLRLASLFSNLFSQGVTCWGASVTFLGLLLQPHSEKGLGTRMDARFLAIMFNVTLLQQGYDGWKICKRGRTRQKPSKSKLYYASLGAIYHFYHITLLHYYFTLHNNNNYLYKSRTYEFRVAICPLCNTVFSLLTL
jgi:hypothetical protein